MQGLPPPLIAALRNATRLVALTGSGISAESGIPTFREARSGLWERYDPQELATPEAFARDPELVWQWYEGSRRGDAENPSRTSVSLRFISSFLEGVAEDLQRDKPGSETSRAQEGLEGPG